MSDEIDTSAEAVGRLAAHLGVAGRGPVSHDAAATLRALAAERDALRHRAESKDIYESGWLEAEGVISDLQDRAEKAEAALRLALPLMREDDWGVDYGDGTARREALYAAIAALRQDKGGE